MWMPTESRIFFFFARYEFSSYKLEAARLLREWVFVSLVINTNKTSFEGAECALLASFLSSFFLKLCRNTPSKAPWHGNKQNVTPVIIVKWQPCNCASWNYVSGRKKCACLSFFLQGWHKPNNNRHFEALGCICGELGRVWCLGGRRHSVTLVLLCFPDSHSSWSAAVGWALPL